MSSVNGAPLYSPSFELPKGTSASRSWLVMMYCAESGSAAKRAGSRSSPRLFVVDDASGIYLRIMGRDEFVIILCCALSSSVERLYPPPSTLALTFASFWSMITMAWGTRPPLFGNVDGHLISFSDLCPAD